ncbi:MAG: hypothetical protein ACYC3I_04855, partial [Gemmataceae bacterium]
LTACLLNPNHFHALTLPPEFGLAPAADLLENDHQFHILFVSPMWKEYYQPTFGLSVAGLAYWPLLLLSLASFAFLYDRMPWPRLLVWVGIALLSLYNWLAIPFFAIVAGPIMSLNWLDFAVRFDIAETPPPLSPPGSGGDTRKRRRNWSLNGRAATLLTGLALLIATVPGWLQSQPQFRRLGWSVPVDPSLHAMADTIRGWRIANKLPAEPHWFNLNPEIANYLTYFAPEERVFLDPQGLMNCRDAAEDYLALRQALKELPSGTLSDQGESLPLKTIQRILRKYRVRYWIYDNIGNDEANAVALVNLFSAPQEWILCHLHGRIAIFAWRDPEPAEQPAPDPSKGLALDLAQSAFGPKAAPAPPRGAEAAPPLGWWETCWDIWWRPALRVSSDAEEVALYDSRFQFDEYRRQIDAFSRAWQTSVAAGAIGSSLPHGPIPNSLLALNWSCTYHDLFPPGAGQPARQLNTADMAAMDARGQYVSAQFIEPPSLYLGLRAARRALFADPEKSLTYLRLGQIYQRLRFLPQEGNISGSPSLMSVIRLTQMIAAYQNFLRFASEDESAAQANDAARIHEELYKLYEPKPPQGFGYLDAAVHHLREALNKRTAAGPPPGVQPTRFNQILDSMASKLSQHEGELDLRLKRYELNAAANSPLEKVKAALELGLGETALKALEEAAETRVSNLSLSEMNLVKQVAAAALNLGRLERARVLLPDPEGEPVPPDDTDLYLLLATARGDYAEADRLLADALRHAWQPPPGQPPLPDFAVLTAQTIGRAQLADALVATGTPLPPSPLQFVPSSFWVHYWKLQALKVSLSTEIRHAEWLLLRGWLALESGHCVEARRHLQAARDLTLPVQEWFAVLNRMNVWFRPNRDFPPLQYLQEVQQLGFQHGALNELSVRFLKWFEEKPKP